MDYISTKDAAQRWGINIRVVQDYCKGGRIPGARKYGVSWLLPADAEKPTDPRKKRSSRSEKSVAYTFLTSLDLPKISMVTKLPDNALFLDIDRQIQPLASADIAFRRGDTEPAMKLWLANQGSTSQMLSIASLASAASISSGNYRLYDDIQSVLQGHIARTENKKTKALLSLPGTLAAVSMSLPGMTPEWLKHCDFSIFPYELRSFLLYIYAMHLRNAGEYDAMLATAQATLALCERQHTFTWIDVYLGVLCASAAFALGNTKQSKHYLDYALSLGMPYGFIAPFADHLGQLGGTLESTLEQNYPQYTKPVIDHWNASFKNWMRFHNDFTKDNITTILTPRQYQAAYLIAHGATYAATAERMNLSVSSIKKILTEVYAKLFIQNKQDLSAFIL